MIFISINEIQKNKKQDSIIHDIILNNYILTFRCKRKHETLTYINFVVLAFVWFSVLFYALNAVRWKDKENYRNNLNKIFQTTISINLGTVNSSVAKKNLK